MPEAETTGAFESFKLGDVELKGFEVPEQLPLGGEDRKSVV